MKVLLPVFSFPVIVFVSYDTYWLTSPVFAQCYGRQIVAQTLHDAELPPACRSCTTQTELRALIHPRQRGQLYDSTPSPISTTSLSILGELSPNQKPLAEETMRAGNSAVFL